MTLREYAQLGAVLTDPPLRFVVQLEAYSDTASSEDTMQVGITGRLLVHRATQLKRWIGTIYIPETIPALYGSLADLRALYVLQTQLAWTSPTDDAATNVVWTGPFQPTYVRGTMDVCSVPFMLIEDGS